MHKTTQSVVHYPANQPLAANWNAESKWMRHALHELCQPLSVLQCGLYLATMDGESANALELRQTIDGALVECERLMLQVRSMQEHLGSESR